MASKKLPKKLSADSPRAESHPLEKLLTIAGKTSKGETLAVTMVAGKRGVFEILVMSGMTLKDTHYAPTLADAEERVLKVASWLGLFKEVEF